MILISGDVHGDVDFHKLSNHRIRATFGRLPDYLIVAGDFGCPWSNNPEDRTDNYLRRFYEEKPYQIIVVPGNHENHSRIEEMPEEVYYGARVRRYSKNIVFVEKNQILQIENRSFFCLGGARSIDQASRTPFLSWWPQEEATYRDFIDTQNLLQTVAEVDYIITHTAPESIIKGGAFTLFEEERIDSTSKLLEIVKTSMKFKHWYFGHFHRDVTIEDKYTCLYEELKEIPNE